MYREKDWAKQAAIISAEQLAKQRKYVHHHAEG
jgi:hypothetical protein